MTLVRKVFEKDRTLGELHLEGTGYFCDTLEPHCIDWSREKKVAGKTAIPEGRYRVRVGWSPRRGRNVPWLKKEPHFKDNQIHVGNFPKDTRGCILVGTRNKNILVGSRVVFRKLMGKLQFENDIEIVVKSETEEKTSDSEYLGDELEKFL